MFHSPRIEKCKLTIIFVLMLLPLTLPAEELPIRLQVALISKIVAMEHNLNKKSEISIYVLDAPRISLLLEENIGFNFGNGTLAVVDRGNALPDKKYDVIYIGSYTQELAATNYANKYDVMSLYPIVAGMRNKGSLGLGIKSGKPTFLLDLAQSESEKLNWSSKILKVANLK